MSLRRITPATECELFSVSNKRKKDFPYICTHFIIGHLGSPSLVYSKIKRQLKNFTKHSVSKKKTNTEAVHILRAFPFFCRNAFSLDLSSACIWGLGGCWFETDLSVQIYKEIWFWNPPEGERWYELPNNYMVKNSQDLKFDMWSRPAQAFEKHRQKLL